MSDLLIWLYIINSVLLIDHEIDSAYWKEWELFGLPGGITGFLLLHLPLLFIILWGLVLITRHSFWGAAISLLVCAGGLFAFGAHTYFLKQGRPQFNNWVSKCVLAAILIVSLIQAAMTLYGITVW
jgi:hypothetical protein